MDSKNVNDTWRGFRATVEQSFLLKNNRHETSRKQSRTTAFVDKLDAIRLRKWGPSHTHRFVRQKALNWKHQRSGKPEPKAQLVWVVKQHRGRPQTGQQGRNCYRGSRLVGLREAGDRSRTASSCGSSITAHDFEKKTSYVPLQCDVKKANKCWLTDDVRFKGAVDITTTYVQLSEPVVWSSVERAAAAAAVRRRRLRPT